MAAAEVEDSVYAGAVEFVCEADDAPLAASDACVRLKQLLAGGISESELDALDEAVLELNRALGLTPPEE